MYARGDKIGKLLAYISVLPVILVFCQASKVYWRREMHEVVLLLGMAACEGITRVLKHTLQQPRPDTCTALQMCHSHGMPSSHTSAAFFYATFTLLHSRQRLRQQQRPAAAALLVMEQAATWAVAAAVAVSRIYLGYHSALQVAAGAALGTLLGVVWYCGCHVGSSRWGPLVQSPLCQALGVKDTWALADPLEVERAAAAAAAVATSKQHRA
jgi:dolichyldiphosphatase